VLTLVLAGVSVVLLAVAVSVLRPRVPERGPEQAPDQYWNEPRSRGSAIMLWASIEGAGLVGVVGYFLTGGTAPAVAFALAFGSLVLLRPERLEGS
jgi:hypothetical protein